MLQFIKDCLTYRREVELYKDLAKPDEYGIRMVRRHRLADSSGWRPYVGSKIGISIPRDQLTRIINELSGFRTVPEDNKIAELTKQVNELKKKLALCHQPQ